MTEAQNSVKPSAHPDQQAETSEKVFVQVEGIADKLGAIEKFIARRFRRLH